jgi:hypothetical protein
VSLPIFSGLTPVEPYGIELLDSTQILSFEGSTAEQRYSDASRDMYRWTLRYRLTDANLATLYAFFVARRMRKESFLWKPLKAVEYARTGIALEPATSDGVVTAFSLPTSGAYAGDYPIDDGNAILKRAGVAATKTVQVDARTMTAAVAPLTGGAMTADYWRYARVRLDGPLAGIEPVYSATDIGSLILREVTT